MVTANGIVLLRERPGIRVAHNDPISDTPERILLDLIAELRSPFFSMDPELDPVLDRAEARLREVTGDE